MAARGNTDGRDAPRGAIGARVRSARERHGWKRETLAFHSGVSWAAIAQVETGRRTNLRPGTLSALAGALGVSADYLIDGRACTPPMLEHRCLLYDGEDEFAAAVVPFLQEALERGEPAMVVSRKDNISLLKQRLGAPSAAIEFVERSKVYREPKATLDRYVSFIDEAVQAGGNWVRIVGEIAWDGPSKPVVWGRYESLLNLTLASAPATIVCPYDTRVVGDDILDIARATHPQLIDRDGLTSSGDYARLGGLLEDR